MTGSRFPVLLLPALASLFPASVLAGPPHAFVEEFTTTEFRDVAATTALWDTAAGEVRLPPFTPNILGTYDSPGSARGVAIAGHRAFVADYGSGLAILDITLPYSPTYVGSYNTTGSSYNVAVDGDYAFVADGAAGLVILDITNPAAPALAGTYNSPGSARCVAVAGNHAYLADLDYGLRVLDITNPAAPVLTDSYKTTGLAYGVALAGNVAFVADGVSGLWSFDVTDPANILALDTYDTPGISVGVAISGNVVCVADDNGGVRFFDAADPASLVLLGTLDTRGNASGVAVDGPWLYVTDSVDGLCIVDFTDPASPAILFTGATPGSPFGVAVAADRAFVAGGTWGLHVIRVSDPRTPRYLADLALSDSGYDIVVSGDHAYVANGYAGVAVLDISDPEAPVQVGSCATPAFANDLVVDGDHVYVAATYSGLQVIDVGNPLNPVIVGSYNTPDYATGVAVAGDHAFVADDDTGLLILDISNPAAPTLVGTYDTAGTAFKVDVDGDYAYVTDRPGQLLVIDISDPAAPTLAGSLGGLHLAVWGVDVAGDRAYVADYEAGLAVVDVSNPALPSLIDRYDSYQACDVFATGHQVYVADNSAGLLVIDVSDPQNMWPVGSYDTAFTTRGVAVAGDHAFIAEYGSPNGDVQVFQVFRRLFDTDRNIGQSIRVNQGSDTIARVRLETQESGGLIQWKVSATGGASWDTITAGAGWMRPAQPGADLRWQSAHYMTLPPQNPTCARLELEWLFEVPTIDWVRDIPGDQGGRVRLAFGRSAFDFAEETTTPIVSYAVWRRVDDLLLAPAVARALASAAAPDAGAVSGGGAFGDLPVVSVAGATYVVAGAPLQAAGLPAGIWEALGSIPAVQQDQYLCPAATLADSSETVPWAVFCVTAHTATPSVWFASAPDSGYSVDNIAPQVPTGFTATYNGASGAALAWDPCPDDDFGYFRVYCGATPDFVPGPETLVHMTIGTSWIDAGAPGEVRWYKLCAVDHAGNESGPASPGSVTAVDPASAPLVLALHQNVPNPFRGPTTLRFDLPEAGAVRLGIYDVAGRLRRSLIESDLPPGRHEIVWDGRDAAGRPLAEGTYFCRIETASGFLNRKMMLLR